MCNFCSLLAVCDETCRDAVLDQYSGLLVCTVSGQCFDRWLAPEEESDTVSNNCSSIVHCPLFSVWWLNENSFQITVSGLFIVLSWPPVM